MQIKVELITQYILVLNNSCYARGHYFAEDDWKLKIKADTLEEISEIGIPIIFKAIYEDDFYLSSAELYTSTFIVWNGKEYEVDSNDRKPMNSATAHALFKSMHDSTKFNELLQERERIKKEEDDAERARQEFDKQEKEKELLKKLKEKYE